MSFDTLKQVDAGVLNVGYAEAGPVDGPAVVLLNVADVILTAAAAAGPPTAAGVR